MILTHEFVQLYRVFAGEIITMKKYIFIFIAALALTITACGKKGAEPKETGKAPELQAGEVQESGTQADQSEDYEAELEEDPAFQEPFVSTLTDEGKIVTRNDRGKIGFMSGDFYGKPVTDEAEALEAIYSVMTDVGGSEDTELRHDLTATMGGVTYYTFVPTQDGKDFYEGEVKVAADRSGTVLGIVSSLKEGPFDEDTLSEPVDYQIKNEKTAFFNKLIPDTLTQTVEYGENGKTEITVPVSKDPKTGETFLADVDRGIICVDKDDYENDGKMTVLEPCADKYSDYELAYYDACIKVFDYYEAKGWKIPNGRGSLLMLCIDRGTAGEPVPANMAAYTGYVEGFEHMQLSARLPNEIDVSLLGHEYTHMVSHSNHVGEYLNETGAIDEGLSDIMGFAIEMSVLNKDGSEWLDDYETERKEAGYPNFVWDEYYTPHAAFYAPDNDGGNVHHNSNCISMIFLRLDEAGMTADEQFDFWIQADLALTWDTDFKQFGERLPWCMEIAGYPQYEQVLREAIAETRLLDTGVVEEPQPGLALVRFDYPDVDLSDNNELYFSFDDLNSSCRTTWPEAKTGKVAASLSQGYYYVYLRVADRYADEGEPPAYYLYYPERGWERVSGYVIENYEFEELTDPIAVEEGEKLTLVTKGLPET